MGGFDSLLAFAFLCVFLSQQIILPKAHVVYQPFLPTTLDLTFCQRWRKKRPRKWKSKRNLQKQNSPRRHTKTPVVGRDRRSSALQISPKNCSSRKPCFCILLGDIFRIHKQYVPTCNMLVKGVWYSTVLNPFCDSTIDPDACATYINLLSRFIFILFLPPHLRRLPIRH